MMEITEISGQDLLIDVRLHVCECESLAVELKGCGNPGPEYIGEALRLAALVAREKELTRLRDLQAAQIDVEQSEAK